MSRAVSVDALIAIHQKAEHNASFKKKNCVRCVLLFLSLDAAACFLLVVMTIDN